MPRGSSRQLQSLVRAYTGCDSGGPPGPSGVAAAASSSASGSRRDADGPPLRPRPHAAAARARLATRLAGLRSCRQSPQPGDGASRWGARGGASECLRPSWAQMAAGPGQLRLGGTQRSVAPATAGAAGSNAGQAGPGAAPALGCSCRFPPPSGDGTGCAHGAACPPVPDIPFVFPLSRRCPTWPSSWRSGSSSSTVFTTN